MVNATGMTQSIWRQATGSTVDIRFPTAAKDLSLLHVIQTGSEVHPAFYTMGTGGSFRGGKACQVSRSRMVESYLHSPVRFYDMVINELNAKTALS
jgi:hypothetical protein